MNANDNVKLIKTDLLGNPLTEKETVFTINGQDQTTTNGEISLATEKEITEDGQKDEYKIKESSAPEGFELYTGEVNLIAVGKELDESFELDKENKYIVVYFKDNGCGFDFENTIYDREKHTGFGMEMLKERVSLLNGTINYSNENGSKFVIRIPVWWGGFYNGG